MSQKKKVRKVRPAISIIEGKLVVDITHAKSQEKASASHHLRDHLQTLAKLQVDGLEKIGELYSRKSDALYGTPDASEDLVISGPLSKAPISLPRKNSLQKEQKISISESLPDVLNQNPSKTHARKIKGPETHSSIHTKTKNAMLRAIKGLSLALEKQRQNASPQKNAPGSAGEPAHQGSCKPTSFSTENRESMLLKIYALCIALTGHDMKKATKAAAAVEQMFSTVGVKMPLSPRQLCTWLKEAHKLESPQSGPEERRL